VQKRCENSLTRTYVKGGEETYILCRTAGRKEKEKAIRSHFAEKIEKALAGLEKRIVEGQLKDRDKMLLQVGRIQAACCEGSRRGRRRPGPPLRPNRSALRAPQGYAPGQADDKEKKKNEKQKGDTSNEVRKGTFLKRFDTARYVRLTPEGGRHMVLRKDKVEIGNSRLVSNF
jgi:hypothetical protein